MTFDECEIDAYPPERKYILIGYALLVASAVSVVSLITWLI
jgi:hypothetical protein